MMDAVSWIADVNMPTVLRVTRLSSCCPKLMPSSAPRVTFR
jgi:hypothetical protein